MCHVLLYGTTALQQAALCHRQYQMSAQRVSDRSLQCAHSRILDCQIDIWVSGQTSVCIPGLIPHSFSHLALKQRMRIKACVVSCCIRRYGSMLSSGVPRNFVRNGGFNKFSWGERERRCGGGNLLVRDSAGSYNLVQEISFHIVNFLNFWYFMTIYDDNQFIYHC